MKKLLAICLLSLMTTGCLCRTSGSISESREFTTKPTVAANKTELYCYYCDKDYLRDYFISGNENSRYSITLDAQDFHNSEMTWDKWAMVPWNIVAMLNLFIVVPAYDSAGNYLTITPTLHDKQTGRYAVLSPVKIHYAKWMSFLLAPFFWEEEALDPDWVIKMDRWHRLVREKASEVFVKEAALKIYNPNAEKTEWICESYSCRFGDMMTKKTTTAEDVLYVAENAASYSDFEKVKNKLAKPLTTAQNCKATKPLVAKQIVAKNTQRYWVLVDFYKANCAPDGEFGITKESLVSIKGIPSRSYKVNADTEILSYSSLSANGESVLTKTYTIDRGIVTSVK